MGKINVSEIPLPEVSVNKSVNAYINEFKNFDDESFMIEISSFNNLYESFDFMKTNNLETNSFSYDILNKLKLETRIAHNNFATEEEAKIYLKELEAKELDKNYEIKKVKDIKELYNNYINGIKVKAQEKI